MYIILVILASGHVNSIQKNICNINLYLCMIVITILFHNRTLCNRESNRSADFQETFSRKFSRICSFIDIYRAGSLTPGITLILFTQAIAQLKDIYQGLKAPISINPGLLQDVFTGTLWSTRILSQPENFQETLLISRISSREKLFQ